MCCRTIFLTHPFARISWLPDATVFITAGGRASDFEDAEKWIFFHRLGDRAKKNPEPVRFFDLMSHRSLSPDGRYLIVNSVGEKPCAVYYTDRWGDDTWKPFFKGREGESYGHFYGNHFLASNHDGAPRGKILSIPMDTIENKNTWKEIVTESEAVLRQFIVIGDNLVLSELYHAHSRLRVISLENGREEIVQLPGMGLIASDGAPDCCPFSAEGDNIYFCYETFVQRSCVYTYNLKTKELKYQGKAPE
jgi:prolyl oligopeptidase